MRDETTHGTIDKLRGNRGAEYRIDGTGGGRKRAEMHNILKSSGLKILQ